MNKLLLAGMTAGLLAAPLAAQTGVNQQAVPAQLTLENAIGIALLNNAAYLRLGNDSAVTEAARKNRFTRLLPIPSAGINTNAGPSRNTSPLGTSTSSSSGTSFNFGLSMNVWDGGNSLNQYRISRMQIQQNTLSLARQEIALRVQVINQYYQTQQAERSLALEKRLLASREVELKDTETKFRAVLIDFLAFERAKQTIKTAQNNVLNAEDNLVKAKLSLMGVLGITGATNFTLVTPLPNFADSVRLNADSVVQLALERNPDIRQQHSQLNQARMNNTVMRNSRYMPTVRLSANFSRSISRSGYSALFDPTGRNTGLSGSLNISLPLSQIIDFTSTASTMTSSGASVQDAVITMRDLNTSIDRQVRTAVIDIGSAYRQLKFANDNLINAKLQVEVANDGLEANTINYFNYQTVIDAASDAERNILTAQLNVLSRQLILDQLLGNRPGGG